MPNVGWEKECGATKGHKCYTIARVEGLHRTHVGRMWCGATIRVEQKQSTHSRIKVYRSTAVDSGGVVHTQTENAVQYNDA